MILSCVAWNTFQTRAPEQTKVFLTEPPPLSVSNCIEVGLCTVRAGEAGKSVQVLVTAITQANRVLLAINPPVTQALIRLVPRLSRP